MTGNFKMYTPKSLSCFTLVLTILGTLMLSACVEVNLKQPESFEPAIPESQTLPKTYSNGSIYQENTALRLFEDHRARKVGDILIIVLNESTNASKSATTSTSKENSIDSSITSLLRTTPASAIRPLLTNSTDSSSSFSGSGDSAQKNSITGTIAVTVEKVLANGNLLIRGQKRIWINQGEEFIQFTGIVRQTDIATDNSVQSSRVANARIKYSGKGQVANSNVEGWLSKFFNSKWWPL